MLAKYMELLGYKDLPKQLEKYLLSPSLMRLKNIGYFCGMDYASKDIYNFPEYISRYDHSLTVALITWKLTKDLKATLAGLFHDVSTPCFSHVIDYMNKDYEKQESTEEKTEDIIRSDRYLLDCLYSDNILVEDIIDFKKYSIVDLDRPMLCADRLDGIILTGLYWTKNITIDDVRKIISEIDVIQNEDGFYEICVNDREVAELILRTNNLIDVYCHSREDNYMMELLAKITKRAISISIITYDELFVMDEMQIFKRLESSLDSLLIGDIDLFKTIKNSDIPNIDMPSVKVRKLNPLVNGSRLKH